MTTRFTRVSDSEEAQVVVDLANVIWNEYYPSLIGQEQVDYMLDKFQSLEALQRDMTIPNKPYVYWIIESNTADGRIPRPGVRNEGQATGDWRVVGYVGVQADLLTQELFISKIYLLKEERGKGYARATFEFFDKLCQGWNLLGMFLTVNKGNTQAIAAYEKCGFEKIDDVVTDIGGGFVMDDYVMCRRVDAMRGR